MKEGFIAEAEWGSRSLCKNSRPAEAGKAYGSL